MARSFCARRASTLAALPISALLACACAGSGPRPPPADPSAPDSPYAKPQAVDSGPGCYDHRGRLERTITTAMECAAVTWVWRS